MSAPNGIQLQLAPTPPPHRTPLWGCGGGGYTPLPLRQAVRHGGWGGGDRDGKWLVLIVRRGDRGRDGATHTDALGAAQGIPTSQWSSRSSSIRCSAHK